MTADPLRWSVAIRLFHWGTVILVVLAWWTMEMRHDVPRDSPERALWMNWHVTVGVLVLLVTVLRLGWRLTGVAPQLSLPLWQRRLSGLLQALLYLLLVLMPLCGLLARYYSGRGLMLADRFLIPGSDTPEQALAERFADLHEDLLWPALLILVAVHAVAALVHHVYWRDGTLRSMLR